MRIRYSFVIDENPRFLREGEAFLRTLLGAGVPGCDVVAQVTARSGAAGRSLAARFGVRAIELPLGPDQAFCNKINQLFTVAHEEFDVLAACDTDLAILKPLAEIARRDAVRARRVDDENPPFNVLENVRAFLGVRECPALIAPGCAPQGKTYALNCNGGLLLIPRQYLQPLGEAWLRYAASLVDHRSLLGDWVNHIDQVSWAFAMLELRLPFEELPIEYNFPTPLARKIPAGTHVRPVVLHYHRKINGRGRIRRTGVRQVDSAIRQANRHLSDGSLLSRMMRAGWSILARAAASAGAEGQ